MKDCFERGWGGGKKQGVLEERRETSEVNNALRAVPCALLCF